MRKNTVTRKYLKTHIPRLMNKSQSLITIVLFASSIVYFFTGNRILNINNNFNMQGKHIDFSKIPNSIVGGSTVIALKTKDYICIAADSKLVEISSSMKDAGKICKINIIRNIAYAKTGLYKDSKGILDVDSIVKEAIGKYEDLKMISKYTVEKISANFPAALNDIRETNPMAYRNIINDHNSISIVFIGLNNGKLSIVANHFVLKNNTVECTEIDTSPELGMLLFGAHGEIDYYLDHNPNPLRVGIETGLEFLIKLEADKNPDYVSLPIDILNLDTSGFRWLKRIY